MPTFLIVLLVLDLIVLNVVVFTLAYCVRKNVQVQAKNTEFTGTTLREHKTALDDHERQLWLLNNTK